MELIVMMEVLISVLEVGTRRVFKSQRGYDYTGGVNTWAATLLANP